MINYIEFMKNSYLKVNKNRYNFIIRARAAYNEITKLKYKVTKLKQIKD